MVLGPEETEWFYRVWFALLHYVNEQRHLLEQEPPRSLLDLSLDDLDAYLTAPGHAAHRVSLRRFVRFLRDTGRLDYGGATQEMEEYLRHVPAE